jgi:phage-related protein
MRIIFYRTPTGQEPVRDYLSSLPLRDRAAVADVLDAIREYGLHAPGVRFKQIKGKL